MESALAPVALRRHFSVGLPLSYDVVSYRTSAILAGKAEGKTYDFEKKGKYSFFYVTTLRI
jgi:hypothetical protein